CPMRSGDSKRAGFSVELMVSNLQETVYNLTGAQHPQLLILRASGSKRKLLPTTRLFQSPGSSFDLLSRLHFTEIALNHFLSNGPLSHPGGDTFDGAVSSITCDEDAWNTGFKQIRRSAEWPSWRQAPVTLSHS